MTRYWPDDDPIYGERMTVIPESHIEALRAFVSETDAIMTGGGAPQRFAPLFVTTSTQN